MKDCIGTISPSTQKKYSTRMILEVAELSSSAYYKKPTVRELKKRGPKTKISDDLLLVYVKEVISNLTFHGVGYKKIAARVRRKLVKRRLSVGKNRVYNLMKANNLLQRPSGGRGKKRVHNGSIHTEKPDVMWGTDAKKVWTNEEGWCNFFGVMDHFNSEIITFHMSKSGDRIETLRPVQNAVKIRYGSLCKNAAKGTALRLDLGTSNTSKYFSDGAEFIGVELSYSWARSPECNGMIERFHRTLEEQVLQLNDFKNLEEARAVIGDFIKNYNDNWLLESYGYLSPVEKRMEFQENLNLQKTA